MGLSLGVYVILWLCYVLVVGNFFAVKYLKGKGGTCCLGACCFWGRNMDIFEKNWLVVLIPVGFS